MLDFYWLTIYTVNPSSSANFRETFRPSGAGDDIPDGQILLQLLLGYQNKLRRLVQQDSQTIKLDALTQTRRRLADQTTKQGDRHNIWSESVSLVRSRRKDRGGG